MASLALFAVGGAIGPSLFGATVFGGAITGAAFGAAIFGLAGGFIDGMFLLPALAGKPDQQGPRLDDLRVQTASEGSPVNFTIGPGNRVAGTVIWQPELVEEEHQTESGGGKGFGGGGSSSQTNYLYYLHTCIGLGEVGSASGASAMRAVWADSKMIYDGSSLDSRCGGITFYPGTLAGDVKDSLQSQYQGAANVPRYVGETRITINRLALQDWGNRAPRMTVLLEAQKSLTLANGILLICARYGLDSTVVDVSRVKHCIIGYSRQGPVTGIDMLEPLMLAYNVAAQEYGGKLVFYHLGDEDIVDIAREDLGAHEYGSEYVYPIDIQDDSSSKLPESVDVTFSEVDFAFQRGGQRERRVNLTTGNTTTIDSPISFNGYDAKNIAARVLYSAHAERQAAAQKFMPSYMDLLEGDIARSTVDGETYQLRIGDLAIGRNFLIEAKGRIAHQGTASQDMGGDSPSWTQPGVYVPPALTTTIIDSPALRDIDNLSPGYYYAVCATDPAAQYLGASLYRGTEDAAYQLVASIGSEGRIGRAISVLPAAPCLYRWDRWSTVDVLMMNGELSSSDELSVLNGVNRMWIGSELIAYRDATLIAPRTYRLSNLIRGLRNTEAGASAHVVNELAIDLASPSVAFDPINNSQINTVRWWRAVPRAADISSISGISKTLTGRTLKPFSPVHIRGARDGSNNLTITWKRRSRSFNRQFGGVAPPLLETTEAYEVDIMDGVTVKRTIAVTSASAAYSAANQTTDFGSPQPSVAVRIYQMSSVVGRGNPGSASV